MASKAGEAAASAAKQTTRYARNPYWALQRKQVVKTKSYHYNLARARGAKNEFGKPLFTPQSWPIVTGDLVQITSTSRKRDKDNHGKQMKNSDGSYVAEDWLGAQGKVIRVLRRSEQVVVQGINMRTRIAQPTQSATGHFYKMESPIPYAQVSLVDPKTGAPVSGLLHSGRVRIAKDTHSVIPKPSFLKYLEKKKLRSKTGMLPGKSINPFLDTPAADVIERTYRKPVILAPRWKIDPKTKQPLKDAAGRLVMEPEDIELRAARIKF